MVGSWKRVLAGRGMVRYAPEMRLIPIMKRIDAKWFGLMVAGLLALVALPLAAAWQGLASAREVGEEAGELGDDYELGKGMAWMQRWAVKLWYSGAAENWPLAGFYLHELEELAEELREQQLVEEGHEITPLLDAMLLPQIGVLEGAVEAEDPAGFRRAYEALVASCNACHQATEHGFLVMAVPEGPPPPGQNFAP
jgi:mono/diheme cytochrome c family protein